MIDYVIKKNSSFHMQYKIVKKEEFKYDSGN
jgi:hypothetical protein